MRTHAASDRRNRLKLPRGPSGEGRSNSNGKIIGCKYINIFYSIQFALFKVDGNRGSPSKRRKAAGYSLFVMPITVSRSFAFATIAFFLVLQAFAETVPPGPRSVGLPSVAELVGDKLDSELLAKGKVMRTSVDAKTSMLPRHEASGGIEAEIAAKKPSILVETLYLLKRKAPEDGAAREAELLRIGALMRSFSSLRGIQYYSITFGKTRTLYDESYAIESPENRRPLPDPPLPGNPGTDQTFYVFQKDTSFGANVYTYSFRNFPGALEVTSKNVTRMSIAFIPVMGPGILVSRLIVLQASDGIVFYVESDAISIGFLAQRIGDSFANRATALFDWFERSFAPTSAQ